MRGELEDWQRRRVLLNHDVLLNKVLNSFRAANGAVRGRRAMVEPFLRLFLTRTAEFEKLLDDAPRVLDPGCWAESGPLSVLGDANLKGLKYFLHMDFAATSWVPAKSREGREKLWEAAESAAELLRGDDGGAGAELGVLEKKLHELSAIISAFPRDFAGAVATMAERAE